MRSKFLITSLVISALLLVTAFTGTNYIRYYQPVSVDYTALSKPMQKQVDCLAQNILFEAGHEPKEGQVAVAMVTLNRVASGNYAHDVCGVVKQKTGNTCQFSWVCEAKTAAKRLTLLNSPLYNDIRDLAVHVLFNYDKMQDVTKGATYYHADYVNPRWGLPQTTKIGRHIFYKRNSDIETMNKEIKL